eukprot:g12783.t1
MSQQCPDSEGLCCSQQNGSYTCLDYPECDYKNGGCPQRCVELYGSFKCVEFSESLVDGGWSSWTMCNASCAGGFQFRDCSNPKPRDCSNPKPSVDGKPCVGATSQECNTFECSAVVNGGWSNWSSCSIPCSHSDDGPTQGIELRSCTQPRPLNGGAVCEGNATRMCAVSRCPIPGGYTEWGVCSRQCGNGQRYRNCTAPEPAFGGSYCTGLPFFTLPCTFVRPAVP